jgi:hypothetical protein
MNTLYYFTALQPFVFGMRYWQSAARCALSKPLATPKCIYYVTVAVAILSSGVFIGTMLVPILTFPGWNSYIEDHDKYYDWATNVFTPCVYAQNYLWMALTLVSAAITVYSIYKMI